MPKIVRAQMTPLDRGLAISARKSGMTIEEICTVFHREYRTIQRLFKRHKIPRPKIRVKKPNKVNRVVTHLRKPDGRFNGSISHTEQRENA